MMIMLVARPQCTACRGEGEGKGREGKAAQGSIQGGGEQHRATVGRGSDGSDRSTEFYFIWALGVYRTWSAECSVRTKLLVYDRSNRR